MKTNKNSLKKLAIVNYELGLNPNPLRLQQYYIHFSANAGRAKFSTEPMTNDDHPILLHSIPTKLLNELIWWRHPSLRSKKLPNLWYSIQVLVAQQKGETFVYMTF